MIQREVKKPLASATPRQQSLRINDFGYDYVRFTIFDTDYSITNAQLFKKLFAGSYTFTPAGGNIINLSFENPNPSLIDWRRFIFANFDAKKAEVLS